MTEPMAQKSNARKRGKQRNLLQSIWAPIALIVAALVFLGGMLSSMDHTAAAPKGPAHVEVSLGDFRLTDLDGKPVQLSDYSGQPVLINAWATWCPPCRAEMPALEEFYRAHRSDGFVLLAINAGESVEQVRSFIDAMGFTFPVLLDTRGEVLYSLGIRSFPTSVLVGRDGKVKKIHVGTLTKAQLQREIAPLLKQ